MSGVVVVGSVNLDLCLAAPHLPAPGETVLGTSVALRPGGKGGNQAVAARRLGAETRLFAAVGDDQFGADLRKALVEEGLPLDHVTTLDTATGIAAIVVDPSGENTIVVAPGANGRLGPVTLEPVLGPGRVLVLQLEIPLDTCADAARQARAAGATVLLNAAPLPDTIGPDLGELLALTDILVVNEGEARRLFGSAAPAWPDVARHGPTACVITLGAQGALVLTHDLERRQEPFPVRAVDTTGAGDAFCGALAVCLAQDTPLTEAVRRACAAGALATTKPGAQAALPSAHELETFLSQAGGRPHAR